MSNILIPVFVFWIAIALLFIVIAFMFFIIMRWQQDKNSDKIIFLDKNNRWELISTRLYGREKLEFNGQEYFLKEEAGLTSNRGKALYVFSINKPTPLRISYNKVEWLDSKSLMAVINNDLVRQIITPKSPLSDMLIMYGAIGGIIAGGASIIILLKQVGVF